MTTHHSTNLPLLLCWAALGLLPTPALAALGQAPERALNGAPWEESPAPSGPFRVYQTLLPTGTLVKEYVGLDGLVFAVSWRGPTPPDWPTLLGPHFSTFEKARDATFTPGQRGSPLQRAKDGLVVHASGRSPHFFGYAYLAHLVPQGIDLKQVVQ